MNRPRGCYGDQPRVAAFRRSRRPFEQRSELRRDRVVFAVFRRFQSTVVPDWLPNSEVWMLREQELLDV
jgi:hypothetical protein